MIFRVCFTSLLFAAFTFAQQTPTASVPESQHAQTAPATTIVSHTQLVLVPVVVKNKAGKHIEHLNKDVFQVEENGKPQQLALFEEVQQDAQHSAGVPAKASAGGDASNFASNGTRPRFTVVLLDMLNTPFLKQGEAKRQLVDFLSKGLAPDQPVSLVGLDGRGLTQLQSFTTDTRTLIAALQKVKGRTSDSEMSESEATALSDSNADLMDSTNAIAETISQFLQDSIDSMQAMQQRDITRRTLAALNQIATAYQGTRERKTLIWASAGFPFTINDPRAFANMGTDMVEEYEQTWRALSASNVVVYTVDLVGLDSGMVDVSRRRATSPSRTRSSHGNPMGTSLRYSYDSAAEKQAALRAFADSTGGRPCTNTNDFKKCFAEAIEDSESYYMLGYYLPQDDTKPGWRKLKVQVQVEGAHIRAREGFYVAPPTADTPESRRRILIDALSSPLEYTGIALSVHKGTVAKSTASSANKDASPSEVFSQEFMVRLPSQSLVIDRQNKNLINLEIAAVAIQHGKSVATFSQTVKTHIAPDLLPQIEKAGIRLSEKLSLTPGKYECRFVVRDNESGSVGTVIMPLELTRPTESGDAPAASK